MLLVRDIAAAAEATGCLPREEFCRLTHVRGIRNAHLADPGDRAGDVRQVPLNLDAEVHGRFVTLDYCGHGDRAILEEHESLAALEADVLSKGGITNAFTDFMLAFVGGRYRRYEVWDRRGDGICLVKDGVWVGTADARFAGSAGLTITWID